MELVPDMLFEQLSLRHSGDFAAAQLCPPMQRYFRRLPLRGERPIFFNADRLLNRFVNYPRWLQRRASDFDLFHVTDHSYGQLLHNLPAARTIVTCHDLDTFRCLLDPAKENRPLWFRSMTQRILEGFRKAAHVIAVSRATRDEILRHGLVSPERVTVVHNGVHPSCSRLPDPAADDEAARLLPADSGGAVWVLNVGSVAPRKRMDTLLRVFATIRRDIPLARLVRVGGGFTPAQLQLARELNVEDAVLVLPSLPRNILAAVYRRATLLLFPSEAEGFGLPLIEALACGCPVIASDIPVLREVGGPVAAYCPLADVDAWKDTAVRIISDQNGRERHREPGPTYASRFSWEENARQTAAIYKMVLERA
jgi:glycosyltransferase involved in cell wall biosynthesis